MYVGLTFLPEGLSEATGGGCEQGSGVCTSHDIRGNKQHCEVVGTQVEVRTVPHPQQLEHRPKTCRPGSGGRNQELTQPCHTHRNGPGGTWELPIIPWDLGIS